MIEFILNNQSIATNLVPGTTVLDFVRYHQNLKGTKIGCREGDCGACTILVGELFDDHVSYRSMTSCLVSLANAAGKHIVTIEGINPEDGSLTPVQQAMLDESGTQCGFCTVGFVMSLTGFCLDESGKTPDLAVSSIDGNICRCTGYKSIERAAVSLSRQLAERSWQGSRPTAANESVPRAVATAAFESEPPASAGGFRNSPPYEGGEPEGRGGSLRRAIDNLIVPTYFSDIVNRLKNLDASSAQPPKGGIQNIFVGGGTDVYVQRPDYMAETAARSLFYDDALRGVRDLGDHIEIGGSATVTDLLVSPIIQAVFPNLYKHLKLVSSTPIRNMATLAGNFANASPIGDMTIWFLALDAEIELSSASASDAVPPNSPPSKGGVPKGRGGKSPHSGETARTIKLRDFYLDYKQLNKTDDEYITAIRFPKPGADFRFNFEKVSKRTYLDIATVNTAISLRVGGSTVSGGTRNSPPYKGGVSEALRGRGGSLPQSNDHIIAEGHVSAGGVAPIPLYLKQTSAFLNGKPATAQTIVEANEIMQSEISPISDVRGTADYKRLLLKQLFTAHFVELFDVTLPSRRLS